MFLEYSLKRILNKLHPSIIISCFLYISPYRGVLFLCSVCAEMVSRRFPDFEEMLHILGPVPHETTDSLLTSSIDDIPCEGPSPRAASGRKLTAFNIFMHQTLETLRYEKPDMRMQDKFREASERWKGLTQKEKEDFSHRFCN